MADLKISQLSDGGASQATDEYVVARSGSNFRIDGASVAAAATSVGTLSSLTVSGNLTVDTNTLFVDAANNRVGIGTATPAYNVQVSGASPVLNLNGTGTTGTTLFSTISGGTNGVTAIQSYNGGILAFDTGSTGAGQAERMRIDASGNVGIGTTDIGTPLTFADTNAKKDSIQCQRGKPLQH